jgi:hypothetical protein
MYGDREQALSRADPLINYHGSLIHLLFRKHIRFVNPSEDELGGHR